MIKRLMLMLFVSLVSVESWSETRYTSDIVTVRDGPGTDSAIVHPGIKSNAKLELLEDPVGDWAKIRTEEGLEGWLPKQYLKETPSALLQLDTAKVQLNEAVSKTQTLEKQLKTLQVEHQNLTQQSLLQEQQQEAYAADMLKFQRLAADAENLNQKYREILTSHNIMQTEFDAIKAENDRLKADQTVNHWLFGAGLVILGMVLMVILPALRPQKRHSEWAS
jgi:SH3 domain protein